MDVDESQDLVEDPSDVPVTPTEPTEPTEPTKPTGREDSMREPMADPTEDPQDEMEVDINNQEEPFYVRYYTGHKGKFGHEFLEFDITALSDGRVGIVRYANNSNYRNDSLIKKEMAVSSLLLKELKRIIAESEILKEDDSKWPERNREGKQELEIRLGRYHISFETAKIGSLNDVQNSEDPEGLRVFYYLVQDLKSLIFSLISLNFKIKPI